jgi:hypothetical protein
MVDVMENPLCGVWQYCHSGAATIKSRLHTACRFCNICDRGPWRMGWFRSNRGVVAWVALFALACQLVLSFGHVHAGPFGGGSLEFAAAETGNASADSPPSAPQKDPIGLAGDYCAICASIGLAGALILPILATILGARLFTDILPWSLAASEPASFDHVPFSARGPPHA